jgi:hypothetical protein
LRLFAAKLSRGNEAMAKAEDEDLVGSITPDVMRCLARVRFFEKLEDLLSPEEASLERNTCNSDFSLSESILRACGFDSEDLDDIFAVLRSRGGCCDCEILYNVAEESRLKAEYWRAQTNKAPEPKRHPGSSR